MMFPGPVTDVCIDHMIYKGHRAHHFAPFDAAALTTPNLVDMIIMLIGTL